VARKQGQHYIQMRAPADGTNAATENRDSGTSRWAARGDPTPDAHARGRGRKADERGTWPADSLGGAAAWPLTVLAQRPVMPLTIGPATDWT
jgi:hypothetical protein